MISKNINQKRVSFFLGIFSELVAIIYLSFKFYKIIHWRFKSITGEIDIIAIKENYIIFVEVKSRINPQSNEYINNKQIMRIKKTADIFLKQKNLKFSNYRFDLITMNNFLINHYQNFIS